MSVEQHLAGLSGARKPNGESEYIEATVLSRPGAIAIEDTLISAQGEDKVRLPPSPCSFISLIDFFLFSAGHAVHLVFVPGRKSQGWNASVLARLSAFPPPPPSPPPLVHCVVFHLSATGRYCGLPIRLGECT